MNRIHIYDANACLWRGLAGFDPLNTSPRVLYEAANAAPTPQLWVWDGPRNNDRRRAIFPGYKIRDYTGKENILAGLQVYRALLAVSRAVQIEVPEYEADDVCATLARYYAAAGVPVTVHTSDFDYFQLAANPLIELKGVRPIEGVQPQFVSLYKALCGDSSDRIPGIPGFGPKSFAALREVHDSLDKALHERDANTIRSLSFTPRHKSWLSSDENIELLFAYYEITRMLDVPLDLIERYTSPGQPDRIAAQHLFSKFMF